MKVVSYIAQFLKNKGIETIFELQGGMITRILDEFYRQGGFNIVSMHHEQAAAFAAEAYARVNNKPGVALATSGPGATNLITGIGSCYFDSVPVIFITGQVNLNEQKGDKPTRQIGFQETDIVSIVKPITKAAFAIKSINEIPEIFEEAYRLSMQGRPGPVLIDIPMDIQSKELDAEPSSEEIIKENNIASTGIKEFAEKFFNSLKTSRKPLVLVGRGIRVANAVENFINFINKYDLPVVTSLLGLDSIPHDHYNRIGFIGTYGNRWANYALGSCDLLLVLGSRLDLRQTGSDITSFQQNKKIFHVDIDKAELNNRITNCEVLEENLCSFLDFALLGESPVINISEWTEELKREYLKLPDTRELEGISGINPNIFLHDLSRKSFLAKAYTTDVGNNQMWAAQSLELGKDQLFLSSGGMGAMGYSLPAAIGTSIALGKKPVVAIAGDGGFQINIQELQTIRRNNLPIKIVILNNNCLGMIRQFQDSYFESCYQSTVWGYSAPDFSKIANAYGIESFDIKDANQVEDGLKKLWENPTTPFLLNVSIDIHVNVYPKMMFGSPITKMEPSYR